MPQMTIKADLKELKIRRDEARYWLSRRSFTGPEEDAVIADRMEAFDLAIATLEGEAQ
jgi:hypothetical protein